MWVSMVVEALLDNIQLPWIRHSEVDWLLLFVVLLFFRDTLRFLLLVCWLAAFSLLIALG